MVKFKYFLLLFSVSFDFMIMISGIKMKKYFP